MSAPGLVPLQVPADAVPAKPPIQRPRHDFSSHLKDSPRHGAEAGGQDAPPNADVATTELTTVRMLLDEATVGAAGSKLYPQSLHVVGYLSMLGLSLPAASDAHGLSSDRPGPSDASTTAPVATEVVAAVPSAPAKQGAITGSVAVVAVNLSDDAVEAVQSVMATSAAASFAAPVRFTRRSLRVAGSLLLLRDFTLDPVGAKALLDAIRTGLPGGQLIRGAVVNGTSYSFY